MSEMQIDMTRVPRHIAIIMDGNGRWAKQRNMPRLAGHKAGVEALRKIIEHCHRLTIEYLTVYAFSTENWRRPQDEVDGLMQLLQLYIKSELKRLHKNNVKIRVLGDVAQLPKKVLKDVEKALELTESNTGLVLNIALNYGGRDEIIHASKALALKAVNGELDPRDIDETVFEQSLYSNDIPDPDLMIRTSGEIRLSNFLLWQLAYTEFYFTDVYWPDFDEQALEEAILTYQNRHRRFGGV